MNSSSFYIGTYTSAESEGIYRATFDPVSGQFDSLSLVAVTSNPSFLALSADGELFAVNELIPDMNSGGITEFRINEDKTLSESSFAMTDGLYPCYVSLDNGEEFVLVANYGTGNVISFGTQNNQLQKVGSGEHEGSGPDSTRQEGPHAHFIRQHRNGKVYAVDLGADKVYIYSLSSEGQLTLTDEFSTQQGAGPRHLAFHPDLSIAYLINELNSTINVLSIGENGSLEELQTLSTLPEGWEGDSFCADIHVHPNGDLLFGSNRGHDSIVSYNIESNGLLKLAGHYTEGVNWPRNFAIAPGGDHLLIANEKGDDIVATTIESDGTLTYLSTLDVPTPVCIEFE